MITFQNATEAFESLYDDILNNGVRTNIGTIANYDVCFRIMNPTDRNITTPWRKFKPDYSELEWDWYLSGWPYVTEIKKHAKQPIIMKLSPNVTDITEMARAVEAGGADAVSLINTLTGMKIDIKSE